MELKRGESAEIDDWDFFVQSEHPPRVAEIDYSAYLLDANGRVRGDADMLFFNQPTAPGAALELRGAEAKIALYKLLIDHDVQRIAICLSIDNSDDPAARLADLGSVSLTNKYTEFVADLTGETGASMIVAEIVREDYVWRLHAVGEGVGGGLAAVARHFGVDVGDAPAPDGHGANRRTLARSEKATLAGDGPITMTMSWKANWDGEGIIYPFCAYVLDDGTIGKVYWGDPGDAIVAPYISLTPTDAATGQQEIVLHRPDRISHVIVAAHNAIPNGADGFEMCRPRLAIDDARGNRLTMVPSAFEDKSYWVVIAQLTGGSDILVENVEAYGEENREEAPAIEADGRWTNTRDFVELPYDYG